MFLEEKPSSTLVAPLFSEHCITEEAEPSLVDDQLFPEEREHLAKAVVKRRAEFGTARVCARRALARLGITPLALVPAPDRAPRWPAEIVGSIAHTRNYCAVVVARSEHVQAVGLDVEQDKMLAPELIAMICTQREREQLGAHSERDAIVYFSAKEAFYKCQYPLTKTFLDFADVELDVDLARGVFQARIVKPNVPVPDVFSRLQGAFLRERGLVLSALTLLSE
jgi:4'-phosphopantetheinyl transferase EntD